jgi:hypothetical protein
MNPIIRLYAGLAGLLDEAGSHVGLLGIRLLLAWEFWESGVMKFSGDNWFMDIQDSFPFPFNWVPVDISPFLATCWELLGAIALVVVWAPVFSASRSSSSRSSPGPAFTPATAITSATTDTSCR